jgi:hypothetical protein
MRRQIQSRSPSASSLAGRTRATSGSNARVAAASSSKTGRGQVTAPILLIVPQVKLPKGLDLARDAERAHDAVPGLILASWVEGRI